MFHRRLESRRLAFTRCSQVETSHALQLGGIDGLFSNAVVIVPQAVTQERMLIDVASHRWNGGRPYMRMSVGIYLPVHDRRVIIKGACE